MTDYQVPFQKRSTAKELRTRGWNALCRHFWLAIGIFLLASVLGGTFSGNVEVSSGGINFSVEQSYTPEQIEAFRDRVVQEGSLRAVVKDILKDSVNLIQVLIFGGAFVIAFVIATAMDLFVGAPTAIGYATFNLQLLDDRIGSIKQHLFSGFSTCYTSAVLVRLFKSLIQFAVSLISTIPALFTLVLFFLDAPMEAVLGACVVTSILSIVSVILSLVMHYRYALCEYILAEYPTLAAVDVLKNSKELMKGNKRRLFCLEWSFFGWILLAILTCGLGIFFVSPYMHATLTAFYREVSGGDVAAQVEFPSIDPEDYFTV